MAAIASSRSSSAITLNAAATAITSADPRIQQPQDQRRKWGGCFSGFLCFVPSKTGKRIVPRIPDGNMPGTRASGDQSVDISNQGSTLLNLLAPPSSPASFSNSGLLSTVQSPTGFMTLSTGMFSPGGPASTMFATGPYAHETQLVSPPVFSNFTTEPSTAPVTPPPELVHMTTPSSPDVPFAKLLSSSPGIDEESKACSVSSPPFMPSCYVAANDLATYHLYPGSPTSYLVSPNPETCGDSSSLSFPAQEASFPSKLFGLSVAISKSCLSTQDPNFSCPPQFYLDLAQQTCQDACKQDMEHPVEAYRASFGFSSDDIESTKMHCAGLSVSDAMEGSFIVSHLTGPQGEYGRGNAEKWHMGHLNSAVSRILDSSAEQIQREHAADFCMYVSSRRL